MFPGFHTFMIILRNLQGDHLCSGDNPSLFCFVSGDTIQMFVFVLVGVLPETDTNVVFSVARMFLGEGNWRRLG